MNNVLLSTTHKIKKISLAIDASPLSIAVMDEAVLLAERLEVPLNIICVEDINLFNLAKVPYAKTISPFCPAGGSKLDTETVNQIFKIQVKAVKQALEYALKDKNISASIDIRRGKVVDEVLDASKDSDLLVIGWSGWHISSLYSSSHHLYGHSRYEFVSHDNLKLGSSVKAIMQKSSTPVLVLKNRVSNADAIAIAFSNIPIAETALEAAANIAITISGMKCRCGDRRKKDCEMTIFIISNDDKKTENIKAKANEYLKQRNIKSQYIVIPESENASETLKAFSHSANLLERSLVVIADGGDIFEKIRKYPEKLDDFMGSVLIAR